MFYSIYWTYGINVTFEDGSPCGTVHAFARKRDLDAHLAHCPQSTRCSQRTALKLMARTILDENDGEWMGCQKVWRVIQDVTASEIVDEYERLMGLRAQRYAMGM